MKRFRPATETDVDTILEMMRGYYEEDGYAFSRPEAREAIFGLLRDKCLGCLWTAQMDGSVVAYLAVTLGFSFEYRGRDAFIDEVFVAEEYRGQGLGREAIDVAEAYCRALGVKALHLEVERHRERARGLYERAGFAHHDRDLMTKCLDDSSAGSA